MTQSTEAVLLAVATRFGESGLDTRRFVELGGSQPPNCAEAKRPDEVGDRYGICCGSGLVVFNLQHDASDAHTGALDRLPPTLTVRTQSGEQQYYTASEGTISDGLHATLGSSSLSLSWGHMHMAAQHVRGPGSVSAPVPGADSNRPADQERLPRVSEDREIAELSSEQLLDVMAVDPEYQTGVPQSTLDAYREQGDADQGIRPYDDTALWAHHPRVLATQGAERRLLQSIQRLHNHPENADGGILMWDLLDRAEELGLDSQTALRALGGDLVEEVVLKPR